MLRIGKAMAYNAEFAFRGIAWAGWINADSEMEVHEILQSVMERIRKRDPKFTEIWQKEMNEAAMAAYDEFVTFVIKERAEKEADAKKAS